MHTLAEHMTSSGFSRRLHFSLLQPLPSPFEPSYYLFIQYRPHSATTDIPLSNSQGILSVGIHDWRYSEVTSTSSIYIKSHPTQSSPGHHCSMKRKRGTIHHPGLLSCRRWKPESPGSAILQSGSWMVGKKHVETSSRRH